MPQKFQVVTPTAFVMGQIKISGMTGRGFTAETRIVAKGNGRVTEVTAKNESTYVLLVTPGPWTVTAEVGGVIAEPTEINPGPGETVELDFCFGRQS
jgi:hypothetical protein